MKSDVILTWIIQKRTKDKEMSIPNQSQDKLDKRAEALRENLKKRKPAQKDKSKAKKDEKKKS